jgi:TRAP-type C4-dicarboxylate transport system permease small subunit
MTIWNKLDAKISRIETILVTILLALMILMAFSQIVLRNFFSSGIDWSDALVRYLVVWVAFVGAAIATREGKHITFDLLSRWLTCTGTIAMQALSNFFSAVICSLLTVAAAKFIWFEAQMGSTAFLDLPVWVPELIMPIAFGLMTLRFLMGMIAEIGKMLHQSGSNQPDKS